MSKVRAFVIAFALVLFATVATASAKSAQTIHFITEYNSSLDEWVYFRGSASPDATLYMNAYYDFMPDGGINFPFIGTESVAQFNADSASLFKVHGFAFRKEYGAPAFLSHNWVRGVCKQGPEVEFYYSSNDTLEIWVHNTTGDSLWYSNGDGSVTEVPKGSDFTAHEPGKLDIDFYIDPDLTSYLMCLHLSYSPSDFPWADIVEMNAEDVSVLPGQQAWVDVDITDITGKNITWIGTEIQYDPKVIRIDQMYSSKVLNSGEGKKSFGYSTGEVTPGGYRFYRVGGYTDQPYVGKGTAIRFWITGIGAAGSVTPIKLVNTMLNDGSIDVKTYDGSVTVGKKIWIVGHVYYNGDYTRPVPNVEVRLNDSDVVQAVTDDGGYFEFQADPGQNQVVFSKTGDTSSITVADAALPFLYWLNPKMFPVDAYALDVDRNRSTDGFDSSNIVRFYQGKPTIVPTDIGTWEFPSWSITSYTDIDLGSIKATLIGEGTGYVPQSETVTTASMFKEITQAVSYDFLADSKFVTITAHLDANGNFAFDSNFSVGGLKLQSAQVLNENWVTVEPEVEGENVRVIGYGMPSDRVDLQLTFDASDVAQTVSLNKLIVTERPAQFDLGSIDLEPIEPLLEMYLPQVTSR